MKRLILFVILISILSLSVTLPAFAQTTTTYTGTISAGATLTGGRPDNNSLGCSTLYAGKFYYATQQIQVPTSGTYYYYDLNYLEGLGTDLRASFYSGTFDPTNPLGGGCFANYDDVGPVTLSAGVTYTVMISTAFPKTTGAYTFALSQDAPTTGTLSSSPLLNPGRLNDNSVGCSFTTSGAYPYVTSSFTPSISGDYTYLDLGLYLDTGIDMWIAFYSGTFDPNNPTGGGCVANFDDYGVVHLDAGVTYTVVVTSNIAGDSGGFEYLLLGPGSSSSVGTCTYPLPASGTDVLSIPNSATAYFSPNLQDGANFSIPAGTWHITDVSGDFAQVWISCEGEPVWVLKSAIVGDLSGIGATTVDLTTIGLARSAGACPYILPSDASVQSLPNDAPAYFAPSLQDGANFNVPAGNWWVVYTYGDFSQIWISCQAQPVWVLTKDLAH